jgi:hypothetical protein
MKPPDPFDPDNLRLDGSTLPPPEAPRRSAKPPRHRPGEWFLRGPIPWPWLETAAQLPGRALALALCLWREVGRHKRRTVRLCLGQVGLGVNEQAARRALRVMEVAGLVSVLRKPGRGLEVTLLDLPGEQSGGGGRKRS